MNIYSKNDLLRYKIELLLNKNNSYVREKYNNLTPKRKMLIIRFLICDYLKMNIDTIDFENFDEKELIIELFDSFDSFFKYLKYSVLYKKISLIEKANIDSLLSRQDLDNKLFSIYRGSILDKITYTKKYDIQSLQEYYNNYIDTYGLNTMNLNNIISLLNDAFSELKVINKKAYIYYMNLFIREYYKRTYYEIYKCAEEINQIDNIIFNFINENRIDDAIEKMEFDKEFSKNIIFKYFDYHYDFDQKEENKINEYTKNNLSEKQKRKFGY